MQFAGTAKVAFAKGKGFCKQGKGAVYCFKRQVLMGKMACICKQGMYTAKRL
jgi:hypothetical protein